MQTNSDRRARPRTALVAAAILVLCASGGSLATGATRHFSFQPERGRQDRNADEGRIVRSGDKVRILSSVSVAEDEIVMGDLVAVLGSARVDGQVTGEVVVVLGDLTLGPESRVDDVTVVGGEIRRAPGARITGQMNSVGIAGLGGDWVDWGDWRDRRPVHLGFGGGGAVGWTLFRLILLSLVVAAIVFVAPATVRNVAAEASESPLKAGLIGFGIQIFFVPVLIVLTVVLAISIIGIPFLLLIPFVILAALVASLIGFSGVAFEIGRWLRSRGGGESSNMFGLALLGVVAVVALALVGRGVALGGGLFSLFSAIVLVCAFLFEYAAWTVGMGAAALAGFSRKRYVALPAGPTGSPPAGAGPAGPPPPPSPPAAPSSSLYQPASEDRFGPTPEPRAPDRYDAPDPDLADRDLRSNDDPV